MDYKFGGYIYRVNLNKSLLKIFEKRERWRTQGQSKFLGYPLLSEERIKLQTSNFVGTFRGSIRTKARENVGNSSRGRSQGVPKIFRAPIYRAHCAVIFAIAQLPCFTMYWAGVSYFVIKMNVCTTQSTNTIYVTTLCTDELGYGQPRSDILSCVCTAFDWYQSNNSREIELILNMTVSMAVLSENGTGDEHKKLKISWKSLTIFSLVN